jgi:sugar lactone lactonase YvrE
LLIVSMAERRLLRLDEGGELVTVADLSPFAPWLCNDMAVDDAGRAYVGHFGWDDTSDPHIVPASLLRVDPDGSVTVAADDLVFPNGVVISPDGATLLVAETFASRVTAFDRRPDGTLSNRRGVGRVPGPSRGHHQRRRRRRRSAPGRHRPRR